MKGQTQDMATILFAWECGAGIGHMKPYQRLIEKLLEKDHKIAFAARNLGNAQRVFSDLPVSLLQAPAWFEKNPKEMKAPWGYVSVLDNQGFREVEGLTGRLRGWTSLLEWFSPDLLIADHAPTVLAAAHGTGITTVASGSGFIVPPATHPLPRFTSMKGRNTREEAMLEMENTILDNLNTAYEKLGREPVDQLSRIFEVDQTWLLTYEELDHYRGREGTTEYLGVDTVSSGAPVRWPDGDSDKRVFVYLKPSRQNVLIFKALKRLGWPTLVYGDGLPQKLIQIASSPRLVFVDKPLDMDQVSREAALAITNAGHTSAAQLLLGGTPLYMQPLHIEQTITAHRVQEMGAGLVLVSENGSVEDVAKQLRKLVNQSGYRESAQSFAGRYLEQGSGRLSEQLLGRVEQLIR